MSHFGPTSNEMTSASKEEADPAPRDAIVQPVTETSAPADAPLPTDPAAKAPRARRTSTPGKAPVRQPQAAATKKVSAKTVSPQQKKKATKSVVAKSVVKKVATPGKPASTSAGLEASASRKTSSSKKALSKKPTAKKAGPVKSKTANRVAAPAPVSKAAAPATVATPSVKVSFPEAVRNAGKVGSKLVRDSFTMPQQDFGLIAALKERALNFKRPTKKSELLRAGLRVLQQLTDADLRIALDSLLPLKAGRPKKKTS